MSRFTILFKIMLAITLLVGCSESQNTDTDNVSEAKKEKLIVFHAGSLSVPLKKMKEEFEAKNPNVKILLESAGSVKCARKITDLKKECDIMASADYTIINEMLIPDHTDWNIRFASNEMTIVYHDASKYSAEINAQNWHEILMKDDVIFGRSDPNADPCGYRAILTSQLAEQYYKADGFASKMIEKNKEYVRPKETDLLALLESNSIDYIFLYRSVAQQHELKFVILPDSVNLKSPELREFYKTASVDITGKKPGTTITKIGQPMVYGITVLKNAPNKHIAMKFADYILSKDGGSKIMETNGQPSIVPAVSGSFDAIPQELKKYAKK